MKKDTWGHLLSHKRQELQFEEASIVVEDGVFTPDPQLTYSSSIIIDNFPSLEGLRVADVGTGTGVVGILAAMKGAKEVIATDNSDTAVQNAKANVELNHLTGIVKILKTNLLDEVKGNFDIIFANLPILASLWKSEGISSISIVGQFLTAARQKLNPKGKIYMAWASFAEDEKQFVEKLFVANGYGFQVMTKNALNTQWFLYILTVRNR